VSRDPRSKLQQAGARHAPQPDPAFADALEARLRAVPTSMPPAPPVMSVSGGAKPSDRIWRRVWVRPLAAGIVVAALVLAAVAQGGLAPQYSVPPLELTAAVNVTVQLADGTTVQNPEDMVLPEGAIVTVGAGGSARIGNVTVNPGEVAVVHGGRAQVERPKQGTASTALATPLHGSPGAPPSGAIGSTQPGATPDPSAPAGSMAPAPSASPAPAPSASPAASPAPIVAALLQAHLAGAHTIAIDWTRTAGAKSYVLVMTRSNVGPAPRPAYPGSRILGTFSRPPAAPVQFVLASGVIQVKLMVVALDKNGHELARSLIVRVIVGSPSASPVPAPS